MCLTTHKFQAVQNSEALQTSPNSSDQSQHALMHGQTAFLHSGCLKHPTKRKIKPHEVNQCMAYIVTSLFIAGCRYPILITINMLIACQCAMQACQQQLLLVSRHAKDSEVSTMPKQQQCACTSALQMWWEQTFEAYAMVKTTSQDKKPCFHIRRHHTGLFRRPLAHGMAYVEGHVHHFS